MVIRITKRAILSALQGARESYPREFLCLLDGTVEKEGVLLDAVVIPPLSQSSGRSASYVPFFLPATNSGLASFHSHPSESNEPSKADLHFFSKRLRWHFIACVPFDATSVACYSREGKRIGFEIV